MVWIPQCGIPTPVLSSPTGTQTSSTTANLSVTAVNVGNGTLYWICSTSGTPPNATQIKAGKDSSGNAAAASANQSISSTGAQTPSASGLTASTTYFAYFLQHGADGVDSVVAASASFTTASAGGLLTITKTFDTNTGSRGSPGSAFGGDATLANNFFNAVDEACNNFQTWFCSGGAKTIHLQFGYGTSANLPVSGAGQSHFTTANNTWSNFRTAIGNRALSANAISAFNSLPVSDPTSGNGVQYSVTNGVVLYGSSDTGQSFLGISSGLTYFWSQSSPNSNWDAVGVMMHEMAECMGWFGTGTGTATDTFCVDWYSWASANTRQFGSSGYFSYDSGSTGSANLWGQSGDARDWNGLSAPGGTDCRNGSGSTGLQVFTSLDKTVMDCLGWQWTGT